MTILLCTFSTSTVFAGSWQQDANGWWWQNDDGSRPASSWAWCDGNGDGIAECYYFDGNGYCLMNTTTPDGFIVNAEGAWIENGVVKTQEVSSAGKSGNSSTDISENTTGFGGIYYLSNENIAGMTPSSYGFGEKHYVFLMPRGDGYGYEVSSPDFGMRVLNIQASAGGWYGAEDEVKYFLSSEGMLSSEGGDSAERYSRVADYQKNDNLQGTFAWQSAEDSSGIWLDISRAKYGFDLVSMGITRLAGFEGVGLTGTDGKLYFNLRAPDYSWITGYFYQEGNHYILTIQNGKFYNQNLVGTWKLYK